MTLHRIQRPNRQPLVQESRSKVARQAADEQLFRFDEEDPRDHHDVQMLAGVIVIVAGVVLLLAGLGAWHFIARAAS